MAAQIGNAAPAALTNFFATVKSGFSKVGTAVSSAWAATAPKVSAFASAFFKKASEYVVLGYNAAKKYLGTGVGAAFGIVGGVILTYTIADKVLKDSPWAKTAVHVVCAVAIFAAGGLAVAYGVNPISYAAKAI